MTRARTCADQVGGYVQQGAARQTAEDHRRHQLIHLHRPLAPPPPVKATHTHLRSEWRREPVGGWREGPTSFRGHRWRWRRVSCRVAAAPSSQLQVQILLLLLFLLLPHAGHTTRRQESNRLDSDWLLSATSDSDCSVIGTLELYYFFVQSVFNSCLSLCVFYRL